MRYYNRTDGSLALTLRSGGNAVAMPHCWVEIAPEQDGSESIVYHVSMGHLARPAVSDEPAEVLVVPAVPVLEEPVATAEVVDQIVSIETTGEASVPVQAGRGRKKR